MQIESQNTMLAASIKSHLSLHSMHGLVPNLDAYRLRLGVGIIASIQGMVYMYIYIYIYILLVSP